MSKHDLTAAENKLLMKGFDYATDVNGYDPSWDDADVGKYLAQFPTATALMISSALNIPTHRVVAAQKRLEAARKVELEKFEKLSKTKQLEGNYLKLVSPPDPRPDRKDFNSLVEFIVIYGEWENRNPDEPKHIEPGTKIELVNGGGTGEIIEPINPPGCFINAIVDGEKLQIADGDYVVLGETNILLTEPPRQVEANGQLSIFFDDSDEPPDPDDFKSLGDYQEAYGKWAKQFPELATAISKKAVLGDALSEAEGSLPKGETFKKGDYVQKSSNPKWIGEIKSVSKTGLKVRYCCGFEASHTASELTLFSTFNSVFKLGDRVTTQEPNFKGIVFTVTGINQSGMVTVIGDSITYSFPSNWLDHHVEQIKKSESIPLEQETRKRPSKGCGSGSLRVREANKKRNAAKGRDPDVYYVYYYSYTDLWGKEIKSSISVPREKIAQTKLLIEKKEHYVKIAKFLGKSVPCYH